MKATKKLASFLILFCPLVLSAGRAALLRADDSEDPAQVRQDDAPPPPEPENDSNSNSSTENPPAETDRAPDSQYSEPTPEETPAESAPAPEPPQPEPSEN